MTEKLNKSDAAIVACAGGEEREPQQALVELVKEWRAFAKRTTDAADRLPSGVMDETVIRMRGLRDATNDCADALARCLATNPTSSGWSALSTAPKDDYLADRILQALLRHCDKEHLTIGDRQCCRDAIGMVLLGVPNPLPPTPKEPR